MPLRRTSMTLIGLLIVACGGRAETTEPSDGENDPQSTNDNPGLRDENDDCRCPDVEYFIELERSGTTVRYTEPPSGFSECGEYWTPATTSSACGGPRISACEMGIGCIHLFPADHLVHVLSENGEQISAFESFDMVFDYQTDGPLVTGSFRLEENDRITVAGSFQTCSPAQGITEQAICVR